MALTKAQIKKLYPYEQENIENPYICARCGSRNKYGKVDPNKLDWTIGGVGRGLCDACISKSNIPSEQEREPFEWDARKKKPPLV